MAEIKDALLDFNPWWKEKFTADYKPRDIYEKLWKYIRMPQIISLTGLRRVGKSTLMYKIIEDMIAAGANPKRIIYFSFDEFPKIEIRDLVKEYLELMEMNLAEGKYFLFLDEVQKLSGWENQLKSFYDLHKKKVKILISGSESLFIDKKSKETLGGRTFHFTVNPLTFREFLTFQGLTFTPRGLYAGELQHQLQKFIRTLGFPELAGVAEKEIIKKYIQESIVEKIIYKDIPQLFKVKDVSLLKSLLDIIMEEPGQLIEVSKLAQEMNVSRPSLVQYLSYLEKSFLIRKLYNFSRSRRKVERKLKKYYPSIASVGLIFKEDVISKSKVFEWLVVSQSEAEFFWRDPYKNEVDIVLADKVILPVEVKYGKIDTSGLEAFMKKFNINKGIVVSWEKEEKQESKGKRISVIPAVKFLLEEKF